MKNGGKNKSVVFIICSVCIHTHTHNICSLSCYYRLTRY